MLPVPGKERPTTAARSHALGLMLDLGWHYAFFMATRGEPDRRDYRYDLERPERDLWLVSNRPEGNKRFYSDLVDYNHDASLDLRARFKPWLGLHMTLRAGASLMPKTREVDTRRYYFNDKGPRARDEAARAMPHKEAFAPELIAPDGWQLEEFTRPTDNYTATHRVWAAYLQADVPLWKYLDLVAGLRVEGSSFVNRTATLTSSGPPSTTWTWAGSGTPALASVMASSEPSSGRCGAEEGVISASEPSEMAASASRARRAGQSGGSSERKSSHRKKRLFASANDPWALKRATAKGRISQGGLAAVVVSKGSLGDRDITRLQCAGFGTHVLGFWHPCARFMAPIPPGLRGETSPSGALVTRASLPHFPQFSPHPPLFAGDVAGRLSPWARAGVHLWSQ